MGIGLHILAPRPRKSWWKRSAGGDLAETLAEQIMSAIDEPALRDLASTYRNEDGVTIALHPAAEHLELLTHPRGVVCSVKTSTCGPGFHAYVVELLERAGATANVEWIVEGDEFGDETGYWTERSLERLKQQMAGWLHAVSRSIVEHAGEYENLMINMPIGFPLPADGGRHAVITPIGPRTGEWFEIAAQSPDEALRLAPGFFPWWNRGIDGEFWRGLGLVLAWCNLSWAPPIDDEGRRWYRLTLEAFQRAAAAGVSGLPKDEVEEIESLLSADEAAELPLPDAFPTRVGYRRRLLHRPLTGHWRVSLPGYFYDGEEDDGGTVVYWYGDRTVRGSSITVARRDGLVASAAEMVADPTAPENPHAEVIDERTSDPPGWATLEWKDDESGAYWELTGQTGAPNELCLMTIVFDDEGDRDWAVSTWRSVSRLPGNEDAG